MAALAAAALTLPGSPVAQNPGTGTDGLWWSADLVRHLDETGWEPPYFDGTIRTQPDGYHLGLALRALDSPTTTVAVGDAVYRTSPQLVEAGREIFRNYHFGTHQYWEFRRAIDWATGATDPGEYASRYGVKRDHEGYFVGLVGIRQRDGNVLYGHSCALCHSNVDGQGRIVDGLANHDYDIGKYYDALRPKIKDIADIFLGDSALEVLRFQGPGRTDSTMDSSWAPMRVPHLLAMKGFAHGVRANGDMANLWIQCYRNLNGSYAVESEIMEALMAYMLTLEAPNPRPRGDLERQGEEIFRAQRCHRCHAPPYYSTGQVIDWEVIRTDADRIRNGYPKGYKVASLLRLDQYGLFLHDGSLTSLEQMFDPERLKPDYAPPGLHPARGKRGVPGHPFGLHLTDEERTALVAFLKSL